ncbi:uncharacterized protein [Dendropsophus ebraccatus]|uniref:uncharacterized protein isoform X2 n=1 Tax=Dendropsophus ebraccatus TaxID=150705 RepID=UPI00383216E5
METLSLADFISTYNKVIKEGIEQYAEKNNLSSVPAKHLDLVKRHVTAYCRTRITQSLFKISKCKNRDERALQDMDDEEEEEEECTEPGKCMESAELQQPSTSPIQNKEQKTLEEESTEQEKCMEAAEMHQPLSAPPKIPDINNGVEREQNILEEKCSEHKECMEPSQTDQSPTGPSKIIIDVDPFMKLMAEHHKEQQESQEKLLRTLLDHLSHQEQHKQQQQNKVYELLLQQQQDFQSKLMGDFMKYTENQVTLFSQALSNCKTQKPSHDDDDVVIVNKTDSSCYQTSRPEDTYNSNTGHNIISGRGCAKQFPPFAHFEVANRDKKPSQLFECYELGQEFCKWFYSRLNAQNPSHGQERLDWTTDMFWDEVKFVFVHGNNHEEYIGVECVSPKLLEMSQREKLTFTAKLDSERFKCVNSKHGLVVVAVTGVVSNNDNFSGIFSQKFGLIKCPSLGTYRIRSIYLEVDFIFDHNSHVPPLQYTTEELQEFK